MLPSLVFIRRSLVNFLSVDSVFRQCLIFLLYPLNPFSFTVSTCLWKGVMASQGGESWGLFYFGFVLVTCEGG